jgi:hypothetical protein
MLRRNRFKRFEIILLCFFASILLLAGAGGFFLAVEMAHWKLALASAGILGMAAVYFVAARRGRPL